MKLWPGAIGLGVALLLGGDAMRDVPKGDLIASGELVLRVAPDGGAPVRGRLAKGAAYRIGARQGNWALVRAGALWGWTIDAGAETNVRPSDGNGI